MPRLTQAVPKYRRHRASGQAIVTIAGKDHYLGKHGSKASRMLYDRLIAEYLSAHRTPVQYAEESGITVVEVLAAFWKLAKAYYVKNGKPTSERDAYRVIIQDVRNMYGDTEATEFGPRALKAMRQVWIDRGQKRKTVNQNARKLIRLFRWAGAEELVSHTIAERLSAVAGLRKGRTTACESMPVMPVSLEVIQATLEHLPPVLQAMVQLQLLTGMRPDEVCGLRPMNVSRTGAVWEYRPESHKTEHHDRERVVYIGPDSQRLLTPFLERETCSYCFSPKEVVEHWLATKHAQRVTPASCGNRRGARTSKTRSRELGDRYSTSSYRRAIHRACDRAFEPPDSLKKLDSESTKAWHTRLTEAGVRALKNWQSEHRWSPNQLRHTAATKIRRDFGLEAAQVILGHAAANVTQIYAERDSNKAREVAKAVG